MRPIHIVNLDVARPAVVLTRALVRPHLNRVTVAPITAVIRGLTSEVAVGPANGLDDVGVVSCDNIVTLPVSMVGRHVGYLLPEQEEYLSAAIRNAFDLD